MPASQYTPYLHLPQYADDDKFSRLGDLNSAFLSIDTNATSQVTTISNLTNQVTSLNTQVGVNSDDISSLDSAVSDLAARVDDTYTKTETDSAVSTALVPYAKTADIPPLISTALVPYAKTADVAPKVHTHVSGDITNFTTAVQSVIAATPNSVLTGPRANRPSAASVAAGTIYVATDVPEQYVNASGSWRRFGGGGSLGYAAMTSNHQVSSAAGSWQDVPALSVSFTAGEGPVEFIMQGTANCVGLCLVALQLDNVTITECRLSASGAYIMPINAYARRNNLVAGSTHVAKVQAAFVDAGGSFQLLASSSQPWSVQVNVI